MSLINWLEILNWGTDELEDLRFVGYSYIKQGKYEIALKFFEALCILEPQNSYHLQTLGAIYLEKEDYLLALNYLEKANKITPNHAPTLLNRAKTLFALGYHKQGVSQANRLLSHEDPYIVDQASVLLMTHATQTDSESSSSVDLKK
ncbi:MAG: tetratricopeptide repeat protein [Rhabdochlamydiaceae bacterium]